ncbi:terminase [Mycobacterium phage Argie]|nr:terminase [Mycobacterium phage Argie]
MTICDDDRLRDWFEKIERLEEPKRTQMLSWVKQELAREKSLRAHANAAELAASLDPAFNITPGNLLIAQEIERTIHTRRGRLMITMPPQEGKTSLAAIWGVIRALQWYPEWRCMLASFSSILAEESSVTARNLIAKHGSDAVDPLTQIAGTDELGLALAYDKASAAAWRLRGHRGGMVAVGLGGTISGRPADLLIIDDPIKGMEAADSPTVKRHVIEGFQGDLTTRLAPGAPIILIQTRWAVDDLAGWILEEEKKRSPEARRWRHINIPAMAEEGLLDSLGREPGTWLESARGRTPQDWAETRDIVGARVWAALYQGSPSPLEGGLIKKVWLDQFRLVLPPENPVLTVVGVDPCDSGHGDDAGIVAASLDADGKVAMIADKSAPMTSDKWASEAVKLAMEVGASKIVVESFSARETYRRVVQEAIDAAAPAQQIEIVAWPPVGSGRGGGDALARSTALLQGLENGRTRLVGHFPAWEAKATSWQSGQHQPDGVAALTVAHDELVHAAGLEWDLAAPFDFGGGPSGMDWMSTPLV